ncbi:MAG TPA: hypothetical protein ENN53_05680 [Candidatus Acetothermia bacterium]|nr:hypothetical protein [Candidatus Acetothermia bacterium]
MGGHESGAAAKVAVLGGLIAGWCGAALGAAAVADRFASTGQAYADWYWISRGSDAQWEFVNLAPTSDPHLGLEAFLCLPVTDGPLPAEIEVRFRVATGAGPGSRLYVARLWRTVASERYAMYFGQVFLSRRDLGVGSRLIVRLVGSQVEGPLGVHPTSVRVAMDSAPALALAAPAGEVAGAAAAVSDQSVRILPASASSASAPFLAPGTYRGELGWAGPYTAPIRRGLYKVNLRAGEVITVRIETESCCVLSLRDPSGRKVGEVEGSSWLGLEYRAQVGGAWQILISCREGGSLFPYTLTLSIR